MSEGGQVAALMLGKMIPLPVPEQERNAARESKLLSRVSRFWW
jgi:hypothetical protein